MEKIKELLKNQQLEDALKIINEDISNIINYGTDKYHELFFAKGIVYITKFENTKPVNNEFYREAREDFTNAANAYNLIYNQHCERYLEAVTYAETTFSNLNTKGNVSSYQSVPPFIF